MYFYPWHKEGIIVWKYYTSNNVLMMIKRSKEITWNIWDFKNPTRIGSELKEKREGGVKDYF